MIDITKCNIKSIVLHAVGNKFENDDIKYSHSELEIEDSATRMFLLQYFTASFKSNEYYTLYHISDLAFNEVYTYVSKIFDNPENLYNQSINLAEHLYEQSTHPHIKGGEFYVVYFKDLIVDNNIVDAVGLFKSENKDTFLKISSLKDGFQIESEQGINIKKLDKGCLIFNIEKDNGYWVSIVDNTNKGIDAKYWIEDFLHVRARKDSYNQTQNMLSLCKNFVSQLSENDGKANKALLINKSIEVLRNGSVNMEEFAKEVFSQPELVDKFNDYKEIYLQEKNIQLSNNFEVSAQALKKKGMGSITTIKLDKNFDINIHGGEQFIERGYDKKREMHYYQLFFKEEK